MVLLEASCTSLYALNAIQKQIFELLFSLACQNVGLFRIMSFYCNLLTQVLMSHTFSIVRTNLSQYFLNLYDFITLCPNFGIWLCVLCLGTTSFLCGTFLHKFLSIFGVAYFFCPAYVAGVGILEKKSCVLCGR